MATGVVLLDWSGLSAVELAAATMLPELAVQKSSTVAVFAKKIDGIDSQEINQ